MVVLDTCIIIDHLRSATSNETALMRLAKKYAPEELAICSVSIQELYEGRSTRDPQKELFILSVISPLKILSYNYEIAKLAGKLARELEQPIGFTDAAIAAITISNTASLATLNVKHFERIGELELVDSIGEKS